MPWPSELDLSFLLNLLRISFPDLSWPSFPGISSMQLGFSIDWSMPTFDLPDLDLDLSITAFDSLLVKLRILVSMIQVLSQLELVYSIPFPNFYTKLLKWSGLLELNFVSLLPLGCVVSFNFHSALALRTLMLPAFAVVPLALRCAQIAANKKWRRRLQAGIDICTGLLFLTLFLIYPSTSAAIFATFQCKELSDGSSWLRADLSIDCTSPEHIGVQTYAVAMVVLYPIGTPLFYYFLLRRNRARLEELQANQTLRVQLLDKVRAEGDYKAARVSSGSRQVPWVISKKERAELPVGTLRKLRQLEREEERGRRSLPGSVSKLLKGYELRAWWFEIFECGRKLAVACLPVFFTPSGSAAQLVFGLMICFLCFGAYVHFDPYEDRGNDAVARLCQTQIFFSLLASVAIASEDGANAGSNLDALLVVLWFVPVGLACFLESPILKAVQMAAEKWVAKQQVKPNTLATPGQGVGRLFTLVNVEMPGRRKSEQAENAIAPDEASAITAEARTLSLTLTKPSKDSRCGVQFDATADGVVATEFTRDSLAASAGMQADDILVSVNGEPVTSKDHATALLSAAEGDVALVASRKLLLNNQPNIVVHHV